MLSRPGEIVRQHDPDRFLTALFAPPERRETLFALYAFNHELARAREVAREPMAALIRLQWWREVVEGARRRHEVAGPLGEALDAGHLHAPDLLGMIEGREAETEPVATAEDWRAYLLAAAGGVAVAAGRALGADGDALVGLRRLGAAYGVAGVLRSVPALARQGRCMLPDAVLTAHGLTADAVMQDPAPDRLRPVSLELAAIGRELLEQGRRIPVPRAAVAAALPAVLAARDLRDPARPARPRGFGDRAAVLLAAGLGRV